MRSKRRSSSKESSSSSSAAAAAAAAAASMATNNNNNKSSTPLPLEAIKDILSRVPVKSITRFESVSKPWFTLIKSPDFISAHLRRSSTNPSLLIRRFHNPTGNNFVIFLIDTIATRIVGDIRIPFSGSLVRFPKIMGSCNGLLCLDISQCYAAAFVLWNVATGHFKGLPRPRITDSRRPFWMVATGFGFNSEINDYKLVRIVNFERRIDELPVTKAEVYSWSTGSWRLIDRKLIEESIGSCVINEGQQAVAVNGVLHWLGIGVGKLANRKYVVSFDMGNEEFRKMQIPDFASGICVKVLGFKDSLTLAVYPAMNVYPGYGRCVDRMELWVLDGYGAADGAYWTKLQNVQLQSLGLGSPSGVLNDSELIFKRLDGNCVILCLFDPCTQEIKNLPICSADYSCDVYTYVESLVPVDAGDELLEEEEAS